jgi:hypothetical protein
MQGSLRRALSLVACLSVVQWCDGCSSAASGNRWTRHFHGDIWGGALGEQVHRPDRLVPEAALLATIPVSFGYDSDIQDHYANYTVDSTTKNVTDALQVVLPAIPLTIGTVDWANGDGGRNFEVVAESLGGIVAVQQLFARTVNRERPDQRDTTSFFSGHTSWAFAATTLIVRDLHDPSDDSFHAVDALIYAPAMFVGWERVASNKHWTSDVTCGAFLGVFLTNWIWDAHFGGVEEPRPTIFSDDRQRGIAWMPTFDVIDGRPAFGIKAGF